MFAEAHILSGWCLGNLLPLTPRQRLLCMVAAALPDLDGLGLYLSDSAYVQYHHVLAHNLAFAIVAALVLAILSPPRRAMMFLVYLAMLHVHFALDYAFSIGQWELSYLWPFSSRQFIGDFGWHLFTWQYLTCEAMLFIGAFVLAIYPGRTPLERIWPSANRAIVAWLQGVFGGRARSGITDSAAAFQAPPLRAGADPQTQTQK